MMTEKVLSTVEKSKRSFQRLKIFLICISILTVIIIVVVFVASNSYSDSQRFDDIASLESMKKALDSDREGIKTFQDDQKEKRPISSERYDWYLYISKEYDNGVSLYNKIARKTGSPSYIPK